MTPEYKMFTRIVGVCLALAKDVNQGGNLPLSDESADRLQEMTNEFAAYTAGTQLNEKETTNVESGL